MTTRCQLFSDVSVIARVKTGSDHRAVRGSLNINVKLKKSRLMKSTTLCHSRELTQGPENFQLELQNRFQCLEDCNKVDDMNNKLVETVHAVGAKFCKTRRRRKQKLSDHTLNLMDVRREMKLQSSADLTAYKQLNIQISNVCGRIYATSIQLVLKKRLSGTRAPKLSEICLQEKPAVKAED
ncbi:unnamed protein product [Parnassius apollo]|uniref:(apollo) hypothetical protein n=2 Tax=Parnassius apollo TaxID=110799 RepID=A0A8S3XK02_PARAO|nr:unnamed protein product [Parnassius apollo]